MVYERYQTDRRDQTDRRLRLKRIHALLTATALVGAGVIVVSRDRNTRNNTLTSSLVSNLSLQHTSPPVAIPSPYDTPPPIPELNRVPVAASSPFSCHECTSTFWFPKSKYIIFFDLDQTLLFVYGERIPGFIEIQSSTPNWVTYTSDLVIQLLKYLRTNGISWYVISCGDHTSEFKALQTHAQCFCDGSAFKVRKNAKADCVSEVLEHFEISQDDVLFVDDSAPEIERFKVILPQVETVKVPRNDDRYDSLMKRVQISKVTNWCERKKIEHVP